MKTVAFVLLAIGVAACGKTEKKSSSSSSSARGEGVTVTSSAPPPMPTVVTPTTLSAGQVEQVKESVAKKPKSATGYADAVAEATAKLGAAQQSDEQESKWWGVDGTSCSKLTLMKNGDGSVGYGLSKSTLVGDMVCGPRVLPKR